MQTSTIVTPKSFYVQERDRLYSSPFLALFRELGQNAVDARAKEIRIEIAPAKGKGAFGRQASVKDVIRVTFTDDGHGMTADVIDNVYFKPGESTKRGEDAIGGFGRARLLNFGQVRHRLWTLDSFVDGDGPEYVHYPFSEMSRVFADQADTLQAEFDVTGDEALRPRIDELRRDSQFSASLAAAGGVKGCTIELDINPEEYGPGNWRNPTLDVLMKHLTDYLSQSQLPAKVYINGELSPLQLQRGPARRDLIATLPDGTQQKFGTVHTNRSEKAAHKGRMITRVRGAAMFDKRIRGEVQVVLELDPKVARDVLTANRDGFRTPYDEVVDELIAELAVDTKSALDDRKNTFETIEGRLGKLKVHRPLEAVSLRSSVSIDDIARIEATPTPMVLGHTPSRSSLEQNGYAGVPYQLWRELFDRVRWGNDTFLSPYGQDQLLGRLQTAVLGRDGVEMVRQALEAMTDDDKQFVVSTLLTRIQAAEAEAQRQFETKLDGLPDVHIHTHGEIKGKLRQAMKRNDPRTWDPATGQGQRARSLLAAWTVCCEVAIKTALRYHPKAIKGDEVEWSPGFLYSAPEDSYHLNEYREAWVREAEFRRTDNGVYLLLNPVEADGSLKFSLSDPNDIQRMKALAIHEACHLAVEYHDEDFASLMTTVMGRIDHREIDTRIKAALTNIRDIYAKGRVRTQAMDDHAGIRPADRLLANAFPATTVAASIMAAPENDCLPSPTRTIFETSRSLDFDGTTLTDTATLDELETAIELGLETEYAPAMRV